MANRKYCFVVNCESTTRKTPHKLFFRVPTDSELKKKWFESAGRKDVPKPGRSSYFCCEDHFTLEEDMENYIKFKLFGARLKIKKGVLPHLFECHNHQTDNKSPASHPGCDKLNRRRAIAEILLASEEQPVEIIDLDSEVKAVEIIDLDSEPEIPLDPLLTVVIENGSPDNITSNNKKATYAKPQSIINKEPFTSPVLQTKQEPAQSYSPHSLTYHQDNETRTPEADLLAINWSCTNNTSNPTVVDTVAPKQEEREICESSTEFRSYAYALWTTDLEQETDTITSTAVESKLTLKQEPKESVNGTDDYNIATEKYSHITNDLDRASGGDKNHSNEYCLMNYRNSIVIHVKLNGSSVDEIFKCAKCECTSRQQSDLLRHIRMFHDADAVPYSCTECSYITTWKHYLRDHYRVEHHASDQRQECPQCDYTMKLRYDFDKSVNKSDPAVYVRCNKKQPQGNTGNATCDKSKEVQVQKRVTAKVFICPKCNYRAKWKYKLNRHLHIGCDPDTLQVYKCTRCSYTTKNHVRLIAHMRLKHNPYRFRHKCTKCPFTTKYKKYLTRHERIKHDPDANSYMCTDCNYVTKEKTNLSKHFSRKHDTNAPIYKCASCMFTTTWRSGLVKHFRIRHTNSVETLQCAQCSYATRVKTAMITHFKKEHARH